MTRDYDVLDQPEILGHLFHPRAQSSGRFQDPKRRDIKIPMSDGIEIGASFHFSGLDNPVLLFFHGNGEIVSDYDDLGGVFVGRGINFFVVDYRGYGESGGHPSVSSMLVDCHDVFDFVVHFMAKEKLNGALCVMGRSLGSASALELAAARRDAFNCLIIESGFAKAGPLLGTLGVPKGTPLALAPGLENIEKIKTFVNPCLVIHAEYDHIIPFSDGKALYDACGSKHKTLLEIKGANHNDIFLKGMQPYLENLEKICKKEC